MKGDGYPKIHSGAEGLAFHLTVIKREGNSKREGATHLTKGCELNVSGGT